MSEILTGFVHAAKHAPSSPLLLDALYEERGPHFRRVLIWHCTCAWGNHGDQAGHVYAREAKACAQRELDRLRRKVPA